VPGIPASPWLNDTVRKGRRLQRAATACFFLSILHLAGCRQNEPPPAANVVVHLRITPSPPQVGTAEVSLSITDSNGQPVEVSDLQIEGNMNHAGMKPSFASMKETEAGKFAGPIEFTMGGDWFLLVTGKAKDGRKIESKFDVPGVKSP
jgi:hypothetical protein